VPLYADDYAIVQTNAIVFASTVDPCVDDPEDDQTYLIVLMLQAGYLGHTCCVAYPQRGLRDAAFEQIVALVKHAQDEREEEDTR
jgi:hypothetical protein